MDVSAVGSGVTFPAIESLAKTPAISPGAEKGGASFKNVIADFLQDVNAQELQADDSVKQLVTGETDNIHDVVLALAKADLSFRLLLEIRNRLTDSYQEIMRMQM